MRRSPSSLLRRLRLCLSSRKRGSLLLEAIVSIAIFAIFIGGIGTSLLIGERSTVVAGDRSKATFLAEESLEGVRALAKTDFTQLTAGPHGIRLGGPSDGANNGKWMFSGTSNSSAGFVSQLQLVQKDTGTPAHWYEVQSNVSWAFGDTRNGSVQLVTYVTDWREPGTINIWPSMTPESDTPVGTGLKSIVVRNGYAYITANDVDPLFTQGPLEQMLGRLPLWLRGWLPSIPFAHATYSGPGLYIYDVTNSKAPVRVASSFTLGSSSTMGYQLTINGNRLYVLTSDPAAELKVYDITTPTSLSAPIATYDVPGSGVARSINFFHNTKSVGQAVTRPVAERPSLPMCVLRALVPKAEAQGSTCNYDGTCDPGEDPITCPDCGGQQVCNNNGTCDIGENQTNCPNDCKPPPPTFGDTIIIGTSDGNVYTVLLRDDNTTALLDSVNIDPSGSMDGITGISLASNTYAYISTKHDTKEMLVMDLTQPNDIQFPIGPGSAQGIDEPTAADATVSYAFGSWVMLGRKQASGTDPTAHELKFYPSEPPVPADLASAKYLDIAGSVLSGMVDVSGSYAFIGTNTQLLVITLAALATNQDPPPPTKVVDIGRPVPGVYSVYDPQGGSMLYVVTGDYPPAPDGDGVGHLLIYKPG